jgi:hypothetical protein
MLNPNLDTLQGETVRWKAAVRERNSTWDRKPADKLKR